MNVHNPTHSASSPMKCAVATLCCVLCCSVSAAGRVIEIDDRSGLLPAYPQLNNTGSVPQSGGSIPNGTGAFQAQHAGNTDVLWNGVAQTYSGMTTPAGGWYTYRNESTNWEWRGSNTSPLPEGQFYHNPISFGVAGHTYSFSNEYEAMSNGEYYCAPTAAAMLVDYHRGNYQSGHDGKPLIRDLALEFDTDDIRRPVSNGADGSLHTGTYVIGTLTNRGCASGLMAYIQARPELAYLTAGQATSDFVRYYQPLSPAGQSAFPQLYLDFVYKNMPTILKVDTTGDDKANHDVVGMGYNTVNSKFLTYDPWSWTAAQEKNYDFVTVGSKTIGMVATLGAYDWGDAPDSYGTSAAADGPRYFSSSREWLGGTIGGGTRGTTDYTLDGQPSPWFNLDDTSFEGWKSPTEKTGLDDDDGVLFTSDSVLVTMNTKRPALNSYYLDLWFDLGLDGSWANDVRFHYEYSKEGSGADGYGLTSWTEEIELTFDPRLYPLRVRFTLGNDQVGPTGEYVAGGAYLGLDLSFGEVEDYFVAVPEPATLSVLALGGLALLRRKKQSN